MTGRYKAYPEYKESGVDWVGEIPKDWVCLPLKRNFKIVNGSTPKSVEASYWDGEITWVTPADLSKIKGEIEKSSKNITIEGLNSCGTSIVPEGSLILSTRAPIGTIAISLKKLCTNQGCKSLINTTDTENKFYYYVLSVSGKQLNNLGRGTTFLELSTDELANYAVPTPLLSEQQKIADFLDHETAKIDTLIAKQEKLIELLKEKRQAVISHAVTKGLNSDAPMKDSGVEWLGEVPEHWGIPKIGYNCSVTKLTGFEFTNHWRTTPEGEIIALRGFNIGERVLSLNKTERISEDLSFTLNRSKLHQGDIVLPCTGTLGNAAIIPESGKYHINQNIAKLTFNSVISPSFAVYWLTSSTFRTIIDFNNTSAMQPVLLIGDIRNIIIPVPPLSEQDSIVKKLTKKISRFDKLISKCEASKNLTQERKTALISAVVTGKIDVRDWEAK